MAKQKSLQTPFIISEKAMIWCLWLIAFLLYSNTLTHGFVLDDVAVITKNKFVHKGVNGWPEIFTSFYWQGFWNQNTGLFRPLSLAMFALEWQFLPNSPFIHHFINVVLYSLSMVLLFKFLIKLLPAIDKWILFFTTLLFIVHPVHTEVVANIKSRDEILCLLFFVITSWVLIQERIKGIKYFTLSAFTYLLALFAKEAAITFLPIFGLILYFFKSLNLKEIFLRLWPLLFISILWLAWRHYVIHYLSPPVIPLTYQDNSLIACSGFINETATAIAIFGQYIVQCFYPFILSYDYSFNQIPCSTIADIEVWASILLIIGLLYLVWIFWKSKPVISFGILFFLLSFSLSSNLIITIGTTRADRLLFTPLLGILIAVTYSLFQFTKFTTGRYICLIAAVIFGAKAFTRNKDWKSNDTLFEADFNTSPKSNRVNYNYATSVLNNLPLDEIQKQNRLNEIIKFLNSAVEIDSNDKNSYANLAVAFYKTKDYSSSINSSKKAISLNKEDWTLYGNIADAYFMNKNFDSAIANYKICENHKVIYEYTYNFMGTAFFNKQDYQNAALHFEKGLKLYPNNTETWLNYGNALAMQKHYYEAINAFEKAFTLNPSNKQALYFIAMSYENLGEKTKAVEYLKRYQAL